MATHIAFDVETTGLEPGSRIVELAAQRFDALTGDVSASFETLINPGMPMPPDTAKMNGITNEMLADAPTMSEALQRFIDWLPQDEPFTALGHYVSYDIGMLSWAAARAGIEIPDMPIIDTWEMAKFVGTTKNNKLDTLVEHYGIELHGDAHRALCDADAVRQYFMMIPPSCLPTPWSMFPIDYRYAPLPADWTFLEQSVANGSPLMFRYEDNKGEVTDRTITPFGWAEVKGTFMFHGWCHLRDARRTFRLDRVTNLLRLSDQKEVVA